jgi:antitoxin (DNA-binding transcriptional repressor) of toxin-antitoxin stability system
VAKQRLPVSEARRLLPRLVEQITREGGRVDLTRHGQPSVSIVRTSDIAAGAPPYGAERDALRVELLMPPEDVVGVIRELRSRVGRARPLDPGPSRRRRS